ncbi:unnamed protein product, partial [Chrysoparadoxa australica]
GETAARWGCCISSKRLPSRGFNSIMMRSERSGRRRQRVANEERPLHDCWMALVTEDIRLLWEVQRRVHSNPQVAIQLQKLVSHDPFQDISLITWFTFFIGVNLYGLHMTWVAVFNLFASYILRRLIEAP